MANSYYTEQRIAIDVHLYIQMAIAIYMYIHLVHASSKPGNTENQSLLC